MLCLKRKPQERILIGDDIVITIIDIRGNTVRIGIDAPDDVRVDRPEVRACKLAAETLKPIESNGMKFCAGCGATAFCWACSTCGRDLCNACYRGHAVDCVGLEGGQ